MPLADSVVMATAALFVSAGPKVLANRATALVMAEAARCWAWLSAAGSLRLSAGARPSATQAV